MNSNMKLLMDKALELINKHNNIFICSHVQPDGDNIGSTLALAMAIKKLKGRNANVIKVDEVPTDFHFLPNVDMFKEQDISQNVDLLISLDSSDLNRLGVGRELLLKANKVINIDHHITNENFGDINIVYDKAGSTAEIIYKFIKNMDIDIDKDIATCLYTGISTDTGRFMYSNTTYETHLIVAELIKAGIDINNINVNIYQNRSIERTKLFLDALNNLELVLEGRVGLVSITQEMLKQNDAIMEDSEGVVSFIRDINTVEVACLLKEISRDEVKVSLRSKNHVDVSQICIKFGGGGHVKAAGCTINENIDKAKQMVLNEILESFR